MKICINGVLREATAEEIAFRDKAEAEYWRTVDYGEAVNQLIRERYTLSEELSVLRQRDEKPEEYAAYFTYCEECKQTAKAKKEQYGEVV